MSEELKTIKDKQRLDKIGEELREKQKKGEVVTLKTIKDLQRDFKYTRDEDFVNTPKLKQEAIKWIKKLDKLNKDNYEKPRGYVVKDFFGLKDVEIDWEESSEIYGMIKILKHFFNITEKDLEEEE